MAAPPYVPMPSHGPSGRPADSRPRRILLAAAGVAALAATGLAGYAVGRRSAASPAPVAAAAPAPPNGAVPAPAAAPATPAPDAIPLDANWRVVTDEQMGMFTGSAASPDDVKRDEAVLRLVTFRLTYFDSPQVPPPSHETAVVDGAVVSVPVQLYPDNTLDAQHWGFEIRVPHRALRHRVSLPGSAKVYVWSGGAWTQAK